MEEIILEAQYREETGRVQVKKIRDAGFVPAVIYGESKDTHAVKISRSELLHLVHQHRLENAIITLKIKDDKKGKGHSCLIKDIQYDPVHEHIVHVDFNEISLTKAIKVNVPVEAKGEPVGVKSDGGSLEHVMWEIEVECLPTEIPQKFEVDVSALKIGDAVHIKDMAIPANIKVITDANAVVLSVAAPQKEEAPAEELEGDVKKEPEVIKEKKEVPGEGAAEGKEK